MCSTFYANWWHLLRMTLPLGCSIPFCGSRKKMGAGQGNPPVYFIEGQCSVVGTWNIPIYTYRWRKHDANKWCGMRIAPKVFLSGKADSKQNKCTMAGREEILHKDNSAAEEKDAETVVEGPGGGDTTWPMPLPRCFPPFHFMDMIVWPRSTTQSYHDLPEPSPKT